MTVYRYLILTLITLNILCEKVTAIYILSPYIFLKENGILVNTAAQKTEVCSFLLTDKKCKIFAKTPHHQQGFTPILGEGTIEFNLLCSCKPFCFWKGCQNSSQWQQWLKKSLHLFQRCNQTSSQTGFEPWTYDLKLKNLILTVH